MISLKSQITAKVLNYYFLNPRARHYINELARLLDLDPKNLERKLNQLEEESILKSEFSGKQRYFFLARNNPTLASYRRLILTTVGLEGQLRGVLAKIKNLQHAYIFGSYARNQMQAGSDIDILAVGDHSSLALQKSILPVQQASQREINVVNMTKREFLEKKKRHNAFLKQIFASGVIKLL